MFSQKPLLSPLRSLASSSSRCTLALLTPPPPRCIPPGMSAPASIFSVPPLPVWAQAVHCSPTLLSCPTPHRNRSFLCLEEAIHEDHAAFLSCFVVQDSLLWDPAEPVPEQASSRVQVCNSVICAAHRISNSTIWLLQPRLSPTFTTVSGSSFFLPVAGPAEPPLQLAGHPHRELARGCPQTPLMWHGGHSSGRWAASRHRCADSTRPSASVATPAPLLHQQPWWWRGPRCTPQQQPHPCSVAGAGRQPGRTGPDPAVDGVPTCPR